MSKQDARLPPAYFPPVNFLVPSDTGALNLSSWTRGPTITNALTVEPAGLPLWSN